MSHRMRMTAVIRFLLEGRGVVVSIPWTKMVVAVDRARVLNAQSRRARSHRNLRRQSTGSNQAIAQEQLPS